MPHPWKRSRNQIQAPAKCEPRRVRGEHTDGGGSWAGDFAGQGGLDLLAGV